MDYIRNRWLDNATYIYIIYVQIFNFSEQCAHQTKKVLKSFITRFRLLSKPATKLSNALYFYYTRNTAFTDNQE